MSFVLIGKAFAARDMVRQASPGSLITLICISAKSVN